MPELESITAARRRYGHTLGVAWFSARWGRLGALLARDAPARIGGGKAALIGGRALAPEEWRYVWEGRVRHLPVASARVPGVVSSCLLETEAHEIYLHVDVDVLDPAEIDGIERPVPGGLRVAEVVAAIRAISRVLPIVGADVTGCAADDRARLAPLFEAVETHLRR